MKYLISWSLCLIFVAGCSSNEEKPEPKTYSDDTNRAFDMIERGGSYYIKKPAPAVAAPQIQAPIQQRKQQQAPVQKPQQEKTFTVETLKPGQQQGVEEQVSIEDRINFHDQKKTPTTQTGKTKNAKVDERLIEINQNLA
ncbi:MAG: hypothetical protein H7336_15790, partial [Bacteriovorax sp.]|nr:hypothetical protein [Bacteriovorax sp.]